MMNKSSFLKNISNIYIAMLYLMHKLINREYYMTDTMIRADKSLVDKLKLLKEITGNSSYQRVMHTLAHDELLKTRAFTRDGYLAVGAVVETEDSGPLVIKSVINDMVIFNDMTHVFNGGGACWKLKKVADNVDSFFEGRSKV
jgi:hypothetical protein